MWTAQFWKDAAERAVKTAVQVAIPMVTATSLDQMDWQTAGLAVAGAVLLSLLTSLASSQVGSRQTASLVDEPPLGEPTPPTTLARGVGK
jgi:r1t holin